MAEMLREHCKGTCALRRAHNSLQYGMHEGAEVLQTGVRELRPRRVSMKKR